MLFLKGTLFRFNWLLDEAAEVHLLVEKIAELRKAKDIPDHLIFTPATSHPKKYGPIAEALRKSKLNKASEEGGWRRLSSRNLLGAVWKRHKHWINNCVRSSTKKIFTGSIISRERDGTEYTRASVCQPDFRVAVESELHRFYRNLCGWKIRVENRGKYYEGAGALRDMIQNHLMQLMGFRCYGSSFGFRCQPDARWSGEGVQGFASPVTQWCDSGTVYCRKSRRGEWWSATEEKWSCGGFYDRDVYRYALFYR